MAKFFAQNENEKEFFKIFGAFGVISSPRRQYPCPMRLRLIPNEKLQENKSMSNASNGSVELTKRLNYSVLL